MFHSATPPEPISPFSHSQAEPDPNEGEGESFKTSKDLKSGLVPNSSSDKDKDRTENETKTNSRVLKLMDTTVNDEDDKLSVSSEPVLFSPQFSADGNVLGIVDMRGNLDLDLPPLPAHSQCASTKAEGENDSEGHVHAKSEAVDDDVISETLIPHRSQSAPSHQHQHQKEDKEEKSKASKQKRKKKLKKESSSEISISDSLSALKPRMLLPEDNDSDFQCSDDDRDRKRARANVGSGLGSTRSKSKSKGKSIECEYDGDGSKCPICFQPYDTKGRHRCACLPCGHLFGRGCIEQWMRMSKDYNCPTCKRKVGKGSIRVIYAPIIKAVDNQVVFEMEAREKEWKQEKERMEQEKDQFRKLYMDIRESYGQLETVHQKTLDDYARIEMKIQETQSKSPLKDPAAAAKSSISTHCAPYVPLDGTVIEGGRAFDVKGDVLCVAYRKAEVEDHGIMAFHLLFLSQPSFIPHVHSKPIKDIQLRLKHDHGSGSVSDSGKDTENSDDLVVLTASLDGLVKLTCLRSRSTIASFDLGTPVWSCIWDPFDPSRVFASGKNCTVAVLDLNKPSAATSTATEGDSTAVSTLRPSTTADVGPPMHSIVCVRNLDGVGVHARNRKINAKEDSAEPEGEGEEEEEKEAEDGCWILAASTAGVWSWNASQEVGTRVEFTVQSHSQCTSLAWSWRDEHQLEGLGVASFRQGQGQDTSHIVFNEQLESLVSLENTPPALLMCRCQVFHVGDRGRSRAIVAVGDESEKKVKLWDAATGLPLQTLSMLHTGPVLQIKVFVWRDAIFIGSLSDRQLLLHATPTDF